MIPVRVLILPSPQIVSHLLQPPLCFPSQQHLRQRFTLLDGNGIFIEREECTCLCLLGISVQRSDIPNSARTDLVRDAARACCLHGLDKIKNAETLR